MCGSGRTQLLRAIQVQRLVEQWRAWFNIDIAEEFRGCQEIRLHACCDCELRFFSPRDIFGSDLLYGQLGQFEWYYLPRKWEHNVAAAALSRGDRVLEVGCGPGEFVARLRQELEIDAEGLEINVAAALAAQNQGLPVHLADLNGFAAERADSYDAVCSFQVLEHVPNPGVFLASLARLVRPGGKLLLCVPNEASFLRYQDNPLDMPPHHMTRWNEATFRKVSRTLPLDVSSVRFEPLASYHVPGYVASHAARIRSEAPWARWLLGRPAQKLCKLALRCGLRRLMRGQSLYVELRRVDDRYRAVA